MSQLFRTLSTVLQSRKESRKRNLSFHLPAAISLASSLRLLELDNSYVSLQEIYDGHCRERGMSKEDPILAFTDRFRTMFDPSKQTVSTSSQPDISVVLVLIFLSLFSRSFYLSLSIYFSLYLAFSRLAPRSGLTSGSSS